jgi:hypothetical protein
MIFRGRGLRMRSTHSSRRVSEARTRVVVSRKLDWIAASIGRQRLARSSKSKSN